MHNIGFIGTGNMGSAIASAVYQAGAEKRILLANKTREKAEKLAERLPGAEVSTNAGIAEECDLIFLCVKPHIVPEVLHEIEQILKEKKERFILCSMAAALTCEKLQTLAGGSYPVIRIMPNTPATAGCGVIEYCSTGVTDDELEAFLGLTEKAGIMDSLEERLIDAASAVSGCGPAFAYMFAEALADGGTACGLPRAKARLYAAGMLKGAAEMLLTSGEHSGQLKDAVCSPGGATIQGVRTLEEAGFRGAVMDAVIAAYEKTLQMK